MMEIGTEKEYINGIFVAVQYQMDNTAFVLLPRSWSALAMPSGGGRIRPLAAQQGSLRLLPLHGQARRGVRHAPAHPAAHGNPAPLPPTRGSEEVYCIFHYLRSC
jgi:hypothetical protein